MPFADPSTCPACSHRLGTGSERCPGCGLLLQALLARQLLQTLRTADHQLAQLVVASRRQATAPEPRPAPTYTSPPPAVMPPPLPRAEHHGISTVSMPRLLLGLGALCLLVAAVIFLAVAWSWLGVGGRTTVLVGLTAVSGSLGVWLARRGLRVAGEALTTVGLGLLTLDVIGADNAGWLGDRTAMGLVAVLGGVVLAAALPLAVTTRLVAPQLFATAGLSALGCGWLVMTGHESAISAAVVVGYGALAVVGRSRRLPALVIASAVGAGFWWFGLVAYGVPEAIAHPSLPGLWIDGHGVALLLGALMLLLPLPFVWEHAVPTRALTAGTAAMLTMTAAVPAADEGLTVIGVVGLVALLGWTLVSLVTPGSWRPVPWVSMLVSAVPVSLITAALGLVALENATGHEAAFTRTVSAHLGDPVEVAAPILLLLGVCGLLGATVAVVPRPTRWSVQLLVAVPALAAVATAALHPVPVWTLAGALALLGVGLVADSLRDQVPLGLLQSVAGVLVGVLAMVVALPSDVLTAAVLAVLVLLTAALHWQGWGDQEVWGGLLVPLTVAGFLWVAGEVIGLEESQRGIPILLVVGLLAIVRPRLELEVAAAGAGAAGAAAAIGFAGDVSSALAVHLTVAGGLVTASALVNPGRRALGWAGGLLLVLATWVRLADIGVDAPEPYTLPSAIALLAVGLVHLNRDPDVSTWRALGPGLVLATVPSLLWVLVDPVTPRAAWLGAGCLGLVVLGTRLRWSAPVLVGAGVGTLVVLRELVPYAAEVPQWVLIGLAGTVLTVLGVTWERRLRDLHTATAYVGRLR